MRDSYVQLTERRPSIRVTQINQQTQQIGQNNNNLRISKTRSGSRHRYLFFWCCSWCIQLGLHYTQPDIRLSRVRMCECICEWDSFQLSDLAQSRFIRKDFDYFFVAARWINNLHIPLNRDHSHEIGHFPDCLVHIVLFCLDSSRFCVVLG